MPEAKAGRLLVSYYGDDLTGSTDVMEALSLGGVPTVLFINRPGEELVARFGDCRAIGLAGTSRSETPQWMEDNLAPAFEWLAGLGADICHYKACSTFDSSPTVGSIGRATEIGRRVFRQAVVPLVVGAPQLKRYTAFGQLFAAYRGAVYRIDRHPVMSRHPVTPMDEADLLVHLGRQTALRGALVDVVDLRSKDAAAIVDGRLADGAEMLLLDVCDPETQRAAGAQLWRLRDRARFVVGSSGVEYALLSAWRDAGLVGEAAAFEPAGPVERLAVVSGSVSPTTERQIAHATANGFEGIPVDPLRLTGADREQAIADATAAGLAGLAAGRSVILHTALGPGADRGVEIDRVADARHRIGEGLGAILKRLVLEQGLSRAVIAGGDTSSHALRQLGVDALTVRMPLPESPGSPLCVAHANGAGIDGLEIALKGGQIGTDSYFETIRNGRPG
jgi:uncharacterized protein YgbK (DUF1537 family)